MIVQPRFHRVVVPRLRGAGARALHARAARLGQCLAAARSTPAGVPPRSSGLGLETLARASLGSGRLRRAAPALGQAAAPPRLSRSGSRCGERGRNRSRASRGPAQTRSCGLTSADPEAAAAATGELSGSPVARAWRRHATAGVRCAPSGLRVARR